MAIDDDLGAVGSREPAPKVLVATLQQHLERQVERTGNVALAGVARGTERTVKFLRERTSTSTSSPRRRTSSSSSISLMRARAPGSRNDTDEPRTLSRAGSWLDPQQTRDLGVELLRGGQL